MAQKASASKVSTAAERLWAQLRKDAHVDHVEQEEELGDCGLLVEVLKLGTESRPLMLDRPAHAAMTMTSCCYVSCISY